MSRSSLCSKKVVWLCNRKKFGKKSKFFLESPLIEIPLEASDENKDAEDERRWQHDEDDGCHSNQDARNEDGDEEDAGGDDAWII